MRRRDFITLLGGAAACPLAARAQQTMPVIGYLDLGVPEAQGQTVAAFRSGLSETGFVEGRNVAVDYRWTYEVDRAGREEFAADLVRHRVALIVANSNGLARIAKAATNTIPIVFRGGGDPVGDGLVASLNRPGGNVTGITSIGGELGGKQLGILHELVPGAAPLAVLVQPTPFAKAMTADIQAAGAAIGRQIEVLTAATSGEIDTAFARAVQMRAGALLITTGGLFGIRRVQLATLAIHHKVPILASDREIAEAGGLMSYGADWSAIQRQVGIYAGRILKGEKPADLPVMQPTRFEFVINLQTARVLGIEVPPTLLSIADDVIE
jgi:putative ABC transport system substrate-binding protein